LRIQHMCSFIRWSLAQRAVVIVALNLMAALAPAATLTTLASFNANGGGPRAGLIADAAGNLYGTTSYGGASGFGTVFRLDSATNNLTTLMNFNSANGAAPLAGLIADAAGNLYGTTSDSGASGFGTVFRLDTVTNALTTLVNFDGANGAHPLAGLIADAAGNLYGTTYAGGANVACLGGGCGTVFRLDTATNTLTTLVSFNIANGALPYAGLVADAAGNLYGTTSEGGANGAGSVFRLDTGTNTLTTLMNFDGANGANPLAELIADAAGNLYGTTYAGGASVACLGGGCGTVFRLDAATNTLTTLVSFNIANGALPYAGLVADAAGNLYGTTYFGGANGRGMVFRVSDAEFVVPEPSSLLLLFGCAGWVGLRRVPARLRCATPRG
jgi:uncharacterized repeat protein (TIGR03803 family)